MFPMTSKCLFQGNPTQPNPRFPKIPPPPAPPTRQGSRLLDGTRSIHRLLLRSMITRRRCTAVCVHRRWAGPPSCRRHDVLIKTRSRRWESLLKSIETGASLPGEEAARPVESTRVGTGGVRRLCVIIFFLEFLRASADEISRLVYSRQHFCVKKIIIKACHE